MNAKVKGYPGNPAQSEAEGYDNQPKSETFIDSTIRTIRDQRHGLEKRISQINECNMKLYKAIVVVVGEFPSPGAVEPVSKEHEPSNKAEEMQQELSILDSRNNQLHAAITEYDRLLMNLSNII